MILHRWLGGICVWMTQPVDGLLLSFPTTGRVPRYSNFDVSRLGEGLMSDVFDDMLGKVYNFHAKTQTSFFIEVRISNSLIRVLM